MSESITNLSDAVREFGALPVPVGPESQALSVERLAEIRDRAVYLHGYGVDADEYEMELSASVDVPALLDEIARLRRLVESMCAELNGHECPPPGESPLEMVTRFVLRLMEAERQLAALLTERHSTNEALDDAVQELRARTHGEPDVRPQVLKLRALLAGQREQAGGAS